MGQDSFYKRTVLLLIIIYWSSYVIGVLLDNDVTKELTFSGDGDSYNKVKVERPDQKNIVGSLDKRQMQFRNDLGKRYHDNSGLPGLNHQTNQFDYEKELGRVGSNNIDLGLQDVAKEVDEKRRGGSRHRTFKADLGKRTGRFSQSWYDFQNGKIGRLQKLENGEEEDANQSPLDMTSSDLEKRRMFRSDLG